MDNTMSVNLSAHNTIDSLNFLWVARFKYGQELKQIDDNGTEVSFKEVLDRMKDLESFTLYDKNNKENYFSVDLIKGNIQYKSNDYIAPQFLKEKKNIRLIYFRRRRLMLSEDTAKQEQFIYYFLGLQYLDENNINRKVIFQIDNEGNFVVGD